MRSILPLLGLFLISLTSVPPQKVLQVQMTEFAFRPRVISFSVGSLVTLHFVNRGQLAHQFETDYLHVFPAVITDDKMRVEIRGLDFVRLEPRASGTLTFFARRRGRFPFACTIEGHREAGMEGILEVR